MKIRGMFLNRAHILLPSRSLGNLCSFRVGSADGDDIGRRRPHPLLTLPVSLCPLLYEVRNAVRVGNPSLSVSESPPGDGRNPFARDNLINHRCRDVNVYE